MKQKIEINRNAMETEDRLKNGESRRNFMKRFTVLSAGALILGRQALAQKMEGEPPMQIVNVQAFYQRTDYYEMDNVMYFVKMQNPILIYLDTQVTASVKVKYSLYTYKKTFAQDGKRNWLQGIRECGLNTPLTTQADIDRALDKIYEFPVLTETSSGKRELSWDAYTDPQFTAGQKYSTRDCIHIAAHNADTGELIGVRNIAAPEVYTVYSSPGIKYRIDEHKDDKGNVVKETLSGKVILAYDDSRPIKKITALITPENCGFGAVSFSVANQGTEAMIKDINNRIPGDVIAHLTLTNPTVDKDNKDIKIFDWKDIKTEDGKDFIPNLAEHNMGYRLAIIIETDEMTYTGLKNGFIWDGAYAIPPVPRGDITANEPIEETGINVVSNETGFTVYCSAGVLAKSYAVHDPLGRTLKAGSLSGAPKETIPASDLRNGIYFVQLKITENGTEKTVSKKVVRR